ncbi:MAG: phosphoribosylanthranilate isomerase [Pseudohongiellaceae bacterium]
MSRTRVKICGITNSRDAACAVAAGADALGLNFHAASPRRLSFEEARSITAGLPAFITAIGLFVDPKASEVEAAVAATGLTCLQFHGDEAPVFCASFGLPYIKAIRVRTGVEQSRNIIELAAVHQHAVAILLDSYHPVIAGGTGQQFDWRIAAEAAKSIKQPLILAGGLNAENVSDAIRMVRPYAVDVSSGVETKPGQKDPEILASFFRGVYGVE